MNETPDATKDNHNNEVAENIQQKFKIPNQTPLYHDDRLPPGWHRKVYQRKNGASVGKYDVYICGPNQRKFRSRNELKAYFKKIGQNDLDPDDFDFSVYGTNAKIDNIYDKKGQEGLDERFQCDLCEEIFTSLIDVKDHINQIHKQNPPKVGIEPSPKDPLSVENKAMIQTEVPMKKEIENYICGISDKSENVEFNEIHTINKNPNENLNVTCDKKIEF